MARFAKVTKLASRLRAGGGGCVAGQRGGCDARSRRVVEWAPPLVRWRAQLGRSEFGRKCREMLRTLCRTYGRIWIDRVERANAPQAAPIPPRVEISRRDRHPAPPRTLLGRPAADLPVSSLLRTAPSRARGVATLQCRPISRTLFTDSSSNRTQRPGWAQPVPAGAV